MSGMQVLKRFGAAATKLVSKRAGLRVYRPVLNAQKWADWMAKSGVPNPKSVEELTVTLFTATGNVAVIPETNAYAIRSTSCVFVAHGSNGLAMVWYDYNYYDRHWQLRELGGSEICGCTSRATLVLSDDIGDFELTDEMLLTAPASIVLDGEATEPLDETTINVVKSARAAETVTPTAAQKAKAAALLVESFESAEPNPLEQAILYDLSRGHPVLKAEVSEASKEIAAAVDVEVADPVETEPKPAAETKPEKAIEKTARTRVVQKSEERRILYGFASVATKDGETVVDYADDEITVDALHDIAHLVVKGARQGALEHNGGSSGEIVEAIVLDKDLMKALSAFSLNGPIELDREAVLIGMHFPDDADWADAKDGDWEFSINATVRVEDPAELEAA